MNAIVLSWYVTYKIQNRVMRLWSMCKSSSNEHIPNSEQKLFRRLLHHWSLYTNLCSFPPWIYSINSLDLDDQHIRNVLNWSVSTERLQSLQQLVEGELSFLWILPKIQDDNIQSEWVGKLVTALETGDFDKTQLSELLRDFSKENNLKFPKFMASLRTMLAGIKEGPAVADMMEILGKKTTIQRILKKRREKPKWIPNKMNEWMNICALFYRFFFCFRVKIYLLIVLKSCRLLCHWFTVFTQK